MWYDVVMPHMATLKNVAMETPWAHIMMLSKFIVELYLWLSGNTNLHVKQKESSPSEMSNHTSTWNMEMEVGAAFISWE